MRFAAFVLAVFTCASVPAAAAEPDAAARAILNANLPLIADPDWAQKPSPLVMSRAYPMRAAQWDRQGEAQLICRVRLDGSVSDCGVLSESYGGRYGFGAGALSVTPHFRMTPKTVAGMPVDGAAVIIPVEFKRVAPRWARSPWIVRKD
jgi:periplasmic protein TonB